MSPQLKSFEGPDVQLVLDRIRRELGPDAKINGAEKIRVGGVLGFFAKEHYRVMVEAPDAESGGSSPAATVPTAVPAAANGTDVFSAMAEATDDVNDFASAAPPVVVPPPWATRPPAATAPPPPQPFAPVPSEPPPFAGPMGTSTAADTPATAAMGPATAEAAPTAGARDDSADTFDTVLSRVAHTLGDAPSDHGGVPGSDRGDGPGDNGSTMPSAEAVPSADAVASGDSVPSAEAVPSGDFRSLGMGPSGDDNDDIAVRAARFLAENTPGEADDRVEALRRAGLDDATVAVLAEALRQGAGLEALLLATFGGLDRAPAPPRLPGSLLVVVGHGAQARGLAVTLASEMGADPAAVVCCSLAPETAAGDGAVVRSASEAAERAPGWRRSAPAVVVVDCAVTAPGRSWAGAVITALRPTAVWGVVDATAKSEDVSAWAGALGGLDALALENLDATVSPAAALATGIPVARLDGHRANAARWTATLVDRVTPCG